MTDQGRRIDGEAVQAWIYGRGWLTREKCLKKGDGMVRRVTAAGALFDGISGRGTRGLWRLKRSQGGRSAGPKGQDEGLGADALPESSGALRGKPDRPRRDGGAAAAEWVT